MKQEAKIIYSTVDAQGWLSWGDVYGEVGGVGFG